MSESKKGVHQIKGNGFIFYNSPEIYYYLTLDIQDNNNISFTLIKILSNDTFIYTNQIPFQNLGTKTSNIQDTYKKIIFLIFNNNFMVKETEQKVYLFLNTEIPATVRMFPILKPNGNSELFDNNNPISSMNNEIQKLLKTIQEQQNKINELKEIEKMNYNKIKNLDISTQNLYTTFENLKKNNNVDKPMFKNPFKTQFQNNQQYNNMMHKKTMTMNINNNNPYFNNLNLMNQYGHVTMKTNTQFNPNFSNENDFGFP